MSWFLNKQSKPELLPATCWSTWNLKFWSHQQPNQQVSISEPEPNQYRNCWSVAGSWFRSTPTEGVIVGFQNSGDPPCPRGGQFFRFFLKKRKVLRIAWNGKKIDQTNFQFYLPPPHTRALNFVCWCRWGAEQMVKRAQNRKQSFMQIKKIINTLSDKKGIEFIIRQGPIVCNDQSL